MPKFFVIKKLLANTRGCGVSESAELVNISRDSYPFLEALVKADRRTPSQVTSILLEAILAKMPANFLLPLALLVQRVEEAIGDLLLQRARKVQEVKLNISTPMNGEKHIGLAILASDIWLTFSPRFPNPNLEKK